MCVCVYLCMHTYIHVDIIDAYWYICICVHIGLVGRVFANGLGGLGSVPGCVIPRTLKMVLDTSLLNIQRCKVCIKVKVEQSRERSSASPTPRCSSYWKGSLLVALNYGCQLYVYISLSLSLSIYIYIYIIYIYVCVYAN